MSSSTLPLGVTAGQLTMNGTRDPPSNMLPFQPLIMRPWTGGITGRGAVIAGENDERILSQPELLQLVHQRPELLVHVADVVVVELVDVLSCPAPCPASAA